MKLQLKSVIKSATVTGYTSLVQILKHYIVFSRKPSIYKSGPKTRGCWTVHTKSLR